MQGEYGLVAALKVVYDVISPDANIEEVPLGLCLLEGLNVSIVQQIEAALNKYDSVRGFRLTVVTEMHHSSGSCEKLRVRNTDRLILRSR